MYIKVYIYIYIYIKVGVPFLISSHTCEQEVLLRNFYYIIFHLFIYLLYMVLSNTKNSENR